MYYSECSYTLRLPIFNFEFNTSAIFYSSIVTIKLTVLHSPYDNTYKVDNAIVFGNVLNYCSYNSYISSLYMLLLDRMTGVGIKLLTGRSVNYK